MPKGIYQHKKGFKQSEETKRKMSLAHKGKSLPWLENEKEWKRRSELAKLNLGQKNPNWRGGKLKCIDCGKELSCDYHPKNNKRLRCQECYHQFFRGKNHPNWKGGISKTKEWRSVQDKLKRDKRRRNAVGTYTFEEWKNLKIKYNYTCPCCGKKEPEIILTVDHIIPLIKKGLNNISNIQPLCRHCNNKKYTKIIKYDIY